MRERERDRERETGREGKRRRQRELTNFIITAKTGQESTKIKDDSHLKFICENSR